MRSEAVLLPSSVLGFEPALFGKSGGCSSPALLDQQTLLAVLGDGLIPNSLTLCQPVGSPLVTPPVAFFPLTLLQRPLILLVQNESSEGEILFLDLFDPGVGVVDDVDTLEFEVENLGEVNVVEGVCFVYLVLQRLRWSWRRVVIVQRELGRRN